jgi:hypothetical protein
LRFCKHRKANNRVEVLLECLWYKDSTIGKEPIKAFRIQKLDSGARKLGESNIDWYNPYGD